MPTHHYGASALGRVLQQPFITGTRGFASRHVSKQAMASTLPWLAGTECTVAPRSSPNGAWSPALGIVFAGSRPSSSLASSRTLSNASLRVSQPEQVTFRTDICRLSSSANRISDLETRHSTAAEDLTDIGDPGNLKLEDVSCREDKETASEAKLHTPSTFRISKEALQRAKDAAPGTKESYWSYKLYMGPQNTPVKVHYCKSKNTTERVAQYFLNKEILGFDIEWNSDSTRKSGVKSNVSLIQLACEDRIGLFHVALYSGDTISDLVSPTIKRILEDPGITKVGVGIKADCTRLRIHLDIDSKGLFELSHLYKLVRHFSAGDFCLINKRLVSLAKQVEEHLELPIFKGDVRESEWSQPLGMDQMIYAASDSYANFMLHDVLEYKRKLLTPTPPRPFNAEHNIPIRLSSGVVIPVPDDAAEEFEPGKVPKALRTAPISDSEAAAENIQIEPDIEPRASATQNPERKILRPKAKPKVSTILPTPQAVVDAEVWASTYRAGRLAADGSIKAPAFVALRAYALWHFNPSLSTADIGAMLRNPPLQPSTVTNYVLDAVRAGELPFDKDRLSALLHNMPDARTTARFRSLRRMVARDQ